MLSIRRLLYIQLRCKAKRLAIPVWQRTQQQSSLAAPVADSHDQPLNPKIQSLVSDISKLTLLEVSELSSALKKTLNLPDAPIAMMSTAGSLAAPAEDEEESAPAKVQTEFTLKLMKFDESKKVALIKECKGQLEGMNLVQAKKFVESAPTIVKANISKEEAEKLSAALTAAGATCEIQ